MPIIALNVTMRVVPVNVPCPPPGGVFTVTATVAGRARGVGGIYSVEIFDQDAIRDDLLDGSYNNGVRAGFFRRIHTFFLKCDGNCIVDGPLGNSGENNPTIYAYADGGGGVNATSGKRQIACVSGGGNKRVRRATPRRRTRTGTRR